MEGSYLNYLMNRGFHILLIDLDGSAIATLAFQKFIEPHQQHTQPAVRHWRYRSLV